MSSKRCCSRGHLELCALIHQSNTSSISLEFLHLQVRHGWQLVRGHPFEARLSALNTSSSNCLTWYNSSFFKGGVPTSANYRRLSKRKTFFACLHMALQWLSIKTTQRSAGSRHYFVVKGLTTMFAWGLGVEALGYVILYSIIKDPMWKKEVKMSLRWSDSFLALQINYI